MQEGQVTVEGQRFELPQPFVVLATQNPLDLAGTYPLPEAQVDRFMMKVLVGYPTEEEEFVIVDRVTGVPNDIVPMATTEQLNALQRECQGVYVDPSLKQYAVRLASASRDPERFGVGDTAKFLSFGASPRASIHLIEGARALAFLRGRTYVLPQDVKDLVSDVLRHRLVLTYEALAEGVTPDHVIQRIMQQIPAPEKPLEAHVKVAAS
jgi:MoxR-like ATPase